MEAYRGTELGLHLFLTWEVDALPGCCAQGVKADISVRDVEFYTNTAWIFMCICWCINEINYNHRFYQTHIILSSIIIEDKNLPTFLVFHVLLPFEFSPEYLCPCLEISISREGPLFLLLLLLWILILCFMLAFFVSTCWRDSQNYSTS